MIHTAVYNGEIFLFGGAVFELLIEERLDKRMLGKKNEAAGFLVDAVDRLRRKAGAVGKRDSR